MCNHPNREAAMVVTHRNDEGKATVFCDPCIEPLIRALNATGFETAASCCGHGERPARIALRDGRELFMTAGEAQASQLDQEPMPTGGEELARWYHVQGWPDPREPVRCSHGMPTPGCSWCIWWINRNKAPRVERPQGCHCPDPLRGINPACPLHGFDSDEAVDSRDELVESVVTTLNLHRDRDPSSNYFRCTCGENYVSHSGFDHHIGWALASLLGGRVTEFLSPGGKRAPR